MAALPCAALAQSAGDDQYADPLAPPSPGDSGDTEDPAPAPGEAPVPAPPAGSDALPSPDSAAVAASPSAEPGQTLPRTGLPLAPFALAGAALLGVGVMLRRSLGEPDPVLWPYPVR